MRYQKRYAINGYKLLGTVRELDTFRLCNYDKPMEFFEFLVDQSTLIPLVKNCSQIFQRRLGRLAHFDVLINHIAGDS